MSWGAVQRNQSISYLKPARTRHYEKKKLTEATLPHSHRCKPRRNPSKRSHSHAPRRTSRGARRAPGRQSDSCSNNVQVAATLSTPTSTKTGLDHAHQPAQTIGTSPKRRGSPAHCTSGSRSPAAPQRRTQGEAQRSSPAPSPNRSGRLAGWFCEDPTNHAGNATVTQNACRSRASLSAGEANPQAPDFASARHPAQRNGPAPQESGPRGVPMGRRSLAPGDWGQKQRAFYPHFGGGTELRLRPDARTLPRQHHPSDLPRYISTSSPRE